MNPSSHSLRKYFDARSLVILVLVLLAAAPWLKGQNPPPVQNQTSTNPPMTITTRTFTDLSKKVLPSVVTVYVKRDLSKSLTPEQRQELDRLRRFFGDPQLRQFLPPGMQPPDENGDQGDQGGQGDQGDQGDQGNQEQGKGNSENPFITQGSGSGVIVSSDGYIVTNWHVVGDKKASPEIRVVLSDDTELSGKDVQVVESSQLSDLALLKINRTGLTPIRFGDSDRAQIGDWVAAVGSPLELKQTITQGIISAKHRQFGNGLGDMLQTDAAINPGSSGGALVNLSGELIGVNRMIATVSQVGSWAGYGFAIPSNQVKYFVDQVRSKGTVEYGYVGIFMASEEQDTPQMRQALGLSKDEKGVLVMGATPGSPAAKAGIQEGDLITRVDGQNIATPGDLLNYVARRPVGSTMNIEYLRPQENGQPKRMQASVRIAPRPSEEELAAGQPGGGQGRRGRRAQPQEEGNRLGVQVQPYKEGNTTGLKVTAVNPGSPAAKAGVQPGDVLLKLNYMELKTPEDLAKAFQGGGKGKPQPLYILRGGQKFLVPIQ